MDCGIPLKEDEAMGEEEEESESWIYDTAKMRK